MDDFENCDFVSNFLNNDFDSECFDDCYFYYQSEQGEGWAEYGWCSSSNDKYILMDT